MEPAAEPEGPRWIRLLWSPTLVMSLVLIIVYVIVATAAGDFIDPIPRFPFIFLLMQCDDPAPVFPWTLLTTVFLHANIIHLASNLLFLLFFGFVLEEQVSKSQWISTFFVTGLAGSLSFVAFDVVGYLATQAPNPYSYDCAVGASGAVYGIMGTAVGLRVFIVIAFLLGLNFFAGGGAPAHLGGLLAGLILRKYWSLGDKPFRGI